MAYDELLQALDQLGPDTRDAVILVIAAGLSYREAADVCGVAPGTMKSRVNRGREQLLRLIGPVEPPPPARPAPPARAVFA
jgi:RNA polymerase sigma-70 factor (ECF subfamily)